VRHVLLTNDFPPKVGGIQSYLWELWRRLPPAEVTVLTARRHGSEWWDAQQKFRVVRSRAPVLLPHPLLARKVRRLAESVGAEAVVIDPALPLGLIGPYLGLPYALVLHGAEVSFPGRLPVSRQLLAKALLGASLWVAAGSYPEAEAKRALSGRGGGRSAGGPSSPPPSVVIPPGVDPGRFLPVPYIERLATRARFGLPASGPLVASVSRLVPRKGMDTLIDAAEQAAAKVSGLSVAIAGDGRDRARLERLAAGAGVPVKLLGELTDAELPDFYACADVFALCPRSRWAGLEQEGFGIVLLEAAACAVPCVTLDSGGAAEAVVDEETGIVVRPPASKFGPLASLSPSRRRARQAGAVAGALVELLSDPQLAARMGAAGRRRAEQQLSYDVLALRLAEALEQLVGGPPADDGRGSAGTAE
jgi:phosphatidylinositol alpha-1,6-mannosyltransferase